MPFEKVETSVDFPAQERTVLQFWEESKVFEQLRAKNRGKPRWSFLDGPITANNPMGVHHAWGRTYKDAYQRYFAMTGHELRYQNGFDCQGLWVEVEVEKELGLKSKRDIEELVPGDRFASIDRFVTLCKERVDKYARVQTEQSVRLGYWMDWDRTDADWAKTPDERKSYFTMSEENNYTIWSFLKKCHSRGLVYRGYDAMPWCPRCGVGISQMEMNEGYRVVAHKSVFLRLPLRDRPGESLLAWTTTPWTLTSNVAAAVNPELTYLRVKQGDQVYYVGKGAFTAKRKEDEFKDKAQWVEGVPKLKTLEQLFKEKKGGYEVLGELKGAEMVGWAYDGPFDELPAQQHSRGFPEELCRVVEAQGWAPAVSARDAHRVVAWDEVSEAEGTGIVHIAPGCGKEDFALGKAQGLPPVAPLDESGLYLDGFGELTGKPAVAAETAEWVLFNLQQKTLLFATEKYPHRYPHCWRCKTELLYRLVDEWFIGMSWRDEIAAVVKQAKWIPAEGEKQELDWLKNMGDWMISKKRFWGLALPIWVDEATGDFEVIGSREELKERAVEGWDEFVGHSPHRPWIDKVKIKNPKTGNLMTRVPDVGNPWLDAGIVPYSTMHYRTNRKYWETWFPADFVVESFPGQFRNWFYALLAMSTMMENRPPFKTLLGHALVRDEHGDEMHKSKGNAIEFNAAADQIGADAMRWLYCRNNPSANVNFGYAPAKEVMQSFVLKLWNTYAFFVNYARLDGFDPSARPVPVAERPDIDRWILSDLHMLVLRARRNFESFSVMSFCLDVEAFVDDRLSNWYVRRNRRRFWKSEQGADKLAAYQTLYSVLTTLVQLIAPVVPFLAEAMYRNLRASDDPESVHLTEYPIADHSQIEATLSADVGALLTLVRFGAAARNTVKIKVRQPLAELRVQGGEAEKRAVERFAGQLAEELNIKRVTWHDPVAGPLLGFEVKANMKTLGPKCGPRLQEVKKLIEGGDTAVKPLLDGQVTELALGEIVLTAADFTKTPKAAEGWAGVADRGTQVALDTRITDELAREGVAREVVRFVQDARKTAGLDMADRIVLYLGTAVAKSQAAIAAHREYIAAETLATAWSDKPLDGDAYRTSVKIDGEPLDIHLRRQP
ncbi:MAG: isoleucine--tRNA ligase [Gemmataceae bacterium]